MKYIIIDTLNTFSRARFSLQKSVDMDTRLGYSMHVLLSSVNKVQKRFQSDHVVFALDGSSWRKEIYPPYKLQRKLARQALTEAEQEEDKLFFSLYDDFTEFVKTQTNCSVIKYPIAEADDIIARWIHLHPNDEHIIISSDSDYYQLLTDKVSQYNGISDTFITIDGFFDDKDKPIIDRKTGKPKEKPDPEWLLFEKCIRGDSSDNIFSAYPGVRTKGSKNRVGLQEAFSDRNKQGYYWNNLMLTRWTDHDGNEHTVMDDYHRNKQLIDLTAQPEELKEVIDDTIKTNVNIDVISQVGIRFLKFCGKHQLNKLSESATEFTWLNNRYKGVLHDDNSETDS